MMREGDPIYTVRGARPRPTPHARVRGSGRATAILGGVLVGWMLFMMGLGAWGTPASTTAGTPITINGGVTVVPADGWVSAGDVWNVGPGAVSFKRSGAVVAFAADAFEGEPQELIDDQLSQLTSDFGSFRTLPAVDTTVGDAIPARRQLFSATSASGDVEGEVVAGVERGTGVLMVAIAPFGQLRSVQSDLDDMLASVVVP